ncbi:hypothetical protein ACFQJD_13005 [Haloplanus sp. GCM10025708]|uniref:hypothetical protein n=1 Tax=Haloferacaceae TaxID=1644056 RepID=UPI003622B2DA
MVSPLFERVTLLLSAMLALMGPLAIAFGRRIYTEEQRSRADVLYHAYLLGTACVSIVGTASLVWTLLAGLPTIWAVAVLPAVPFPVYLLQWKFHRAVGYTGWLGTA